MYSNQLLLISFISVAFSCPRCTQSDTSNTQSIDIINEGQFQQISDDECVDFVALWPAADISKKIGKDKKWVFLNYTIDIWDIPPTNNDSGNVVGKLRASSYARIIDRTENDYLVESPMTKVHGWLNKSHVKTISKKNIKTRKLCSE